MGNSFAFVRRETERLSAKAVLSPCRFFKKEAKTLLFRKDAFALWSTGMHAVGIRKMVSDILQHYTEKEARTAGYFCNNQTMPCAIIASMTFSKPAMFAPTT